MANKREREVLEELIDVYSNFPCLWDITSELYKDKNQREQAWGVLVSVLKQIDENATAAAAKKKIENLRSAYSRELKKVKESKRTGSGAEDLYKPNLWYFDLLNFLNKKDEQCRSGVDSLENNEESQSEGIESAGINSKKKCTNSQIMERKKQKLIETAQKLLETDQKVHNTFGIYIGEQLDKIQNTFQRQVAEKLISEVIFLANTDNLNYDSRIETPSGSHTNNNINSYPLSSSEHTVLQNTHTSLSPQSIVSQQSLSPLSTQPSSPSPQYILSTPTPNYNQPCSSLKKYVIVKKFN